MSTPLFLHGFLGDEEDWGALRAHLHSPSYTLPLSLDLEEKLLKFSKPLTLIGYSMGGRIALSLHLKYPTHFPSLILLSTHLGLRAEEEKQKRLQADTLLAQRLETEPLSLFLEKWYTQPLFSTLRTHPIFPSVLKRRHTIDPHLHAALLRHYSLGLQPYTLLPPNTHSLIGKEDLKYATLYSRVDRVHWISGAGHAVHLENPKMCAHKIEDILCTR